MYDRRALMAAPHWASEALSRPRPAAFSGTLRATTTRWARRGRSATR